MAKPSCQGVSLAGGSYWRGLVFSILSAVLIHLRGRVSKPLVVVGRHQGHGFRYAGDQPDSLAVVLETLKDEVALIRSLETSESKDPAACESCTSPSRTFQHGVFKEALPVLKERMVKDDLIRLWVVPIFLGPILSSRTISEWGACRPVPFGNDTLKGCRSSKLRLDGWFRC